MSIPTPAQLLVKLGELSHADVGVPGRRLVHHPVRGWVPAAERPWRIRWLPLWVTCLLPLGVLFGLMVPRHAGVGVVPPPVPAPVPSGQAAAVPAVVAPSASLPPLPALAVELAAATLPAPVAMPSRRPARPAASAPRRSASAPAAPVVFSDPPPAEPVPRPRDVLVAIQDGQTIVAPGPRGLPVPFRVGELLPSGARLLRVDTRAGEAQTDRGVIRLE